MSYWNPTSILKPWYFWRPRQILRRVLLQARRPSPGLQTVPLAWGGSITVDPAVMIGHTIATTAVYDLAVSEVLARLIHPGDFVLDVGANIGYMSRLMGACTGETGALVAVEPHPRLFDALTENLREVRRQGLFPSTQLERVALSDVRGQARLVMPAGFAQNDGTASLGEPGDDSTGIPVATDTLDHLVGGRTVAVMKLDVEGHELAVLRGAAEALGHSRIRHIVYEDHVGPSSDVGAHLRARGYTILQIGYRLAGPMLASAEAPAVSSRYDAPSYLATCDPQTAREACRARGWRVLRPGLHAG